MHHSGQFKPITTYSTKAECSNYVLDTLTYLCLPKVKLACMILEDKQLSQEHIQSIMYYQLYAFITFG